MSQLKDVVAIVTGGDSGMGQAIAAAFAREGADVAVTYLKDRDGAEATRRQIEEAGRRALVRQTDARDPAQVEALFDEVQRSLGAPMILVNSAGIGAGGTPVADMPVEAWENVIRTDLTGPFLHAKLFVRARRREGGRGKIINITSVHEAIPSPGSASYGAAKGGLLTFTRSLALEVAPDRINVNAIAPGLIHTPMTAARVEDPEKRKKAEQHIPLGRPGRRRSPHWRCTSPARSPTMSPGRASPLTAGWR